MENKKQTENGWISVKDRLPEDSEKVIVTTGRETCPIAIANYYKGLFTWYGFDDFDDDLKPVYDLGLFSNEEHEAHYWRPLPKPPKGGKEE